MTPATTKAADVISRVIIISSIMSRVFSCYKEVRKPPSTRALSNSSPTEWKLLRLGTCFSFHWRCDSSRFLYQFTQTFLNCLDLELRDLLAGTNLRTCRSSHVEISMSPLGLKANAFSNLSACGASDGNA